MKEEGEVRFSSPAGVLEGYLYLPQEDASSAAVVVCHPHPRYGGTMDNNVVMAICRGLINRGIGVLRFNFRGVGQSQGNFDGGVGEVEDAIEGLRFLASQESMDQSCIGVAGYSFGAGVALNAAVREGLVKAVSVVACPTASLKSYLEQEHSVHRLFVIGENDQFFSPQQIHDEIPGFLRLPEVHIVQQADHFFHWQEGEVGEVVASFFQRCLKPQA